MLDGDGRAEATDIVYPWLLHLSQELAGVGRKALHVAPLPFGIQGIEGQGGFTAAADSREDHQLVAWYRDVDMLQVVLLCAAYDDVLRFHSPFQSASRTRIPIDRGSVQIDGFGCWLKRDAGERMGNEAAALPSDNRHVSTNVLFSQASKGPQERINLKMCGIAGHHLSTIT